LQPSDRIAIVDQPLDRTDPPGQRVGEDLRAVARVQLDELRRGERRLVATRALGLGEPERDDPAGRGSRDHVEQVADRPLEPLLYRLQHVRRDHAPDPAAIDRQHTELALRHAPLPFALEWSRAYPVGGAGAVFLTSRLPTEPPRRLLCVAAPAARLKGAYHRSCRAAPSPSRTGRPSRRCARRTAV